MKKISILCAAVLMAICSFAEKGAIILHGPETFQVMSVSPNGKWACGIIGDGNTTLLQGMLWNLETGETTYLSTIDESRAFDVTDDCLVVGAFTSYTATGTGIGTTVAGYWKDGVWTAYDNTTVEGALSIGGEAKAVSADGRVAVGYVMDGPKDSDLAPARWVDGKLERIYEHDQTAGDVYTVSADGSVAAGWSYSQDDRNRQISIWDNSTDTVARISEFSSAFEVGYRLSHDGTKLACNQWGNPYVYDLTTGTKTEVPAVGGEYWQFFIWYVGDDGLVMGKEESVDDYGTSFYGYVYDGTKAWKMDEWLKELYNVDIDQSQYPIIQGVDRSDDGKVIALNNYVAETGNSASTIVILDQEIEYCAPVALTGEKMRGVNCVRLTWNVPLMNAENVLGYNLYRGEEAILEETGEMSYIDTDLADGTYTYTVTALYEDENGELIESEKSSAFVIEVATDALNKVINIETHAYNYNDLKLRWEAPESNLPTATYYDPNLLTSGFGGGLVSFSAAIRLPLDVVNNYAGKYSIARVAFVPLHTEAVYTIKVYVNDVEVASKQIDNATLIYNRLNNIDLETPIALSEYDNVLVAVDVDASKFTAASNNVIGMNFGVVVPGYSDLTRQSTEPEYYSLYETAPVELGDYSVSWAISAIFTTVDEDGKANLNSDRVVGYDVYRNGEKIASVEETNYMDSGLTATTYTYGIAAKYADGGVAEPATKEVRFTPDTEALRSVENLRVSASESVVSAYWNAPLKNDKTVISYAKGTSSGKGISLSGTTSTIEYVVGHEYPFSHLEWYEGYNITGLRFYPTDEAIFAIGLEVDGIDVAFIEIGELGAEDGYVLNQWNVVELPEPVKIEVGSSYIVKLVCSEVYPGTYPITMDNGVGEIMITDLYSYDSGFSSAISDTGLTGCWMLGMEIANESTERMDVAGYKVIVDGDTDNAETVTETSYRKEGLNWNVGETHRVRVNAIYNVEGGELEVEGEQQIFNILAGVSDIAVDRVKVYPNPATSYIKVEGAAERLVLVDMSGRAVAETATDMIDVTTLPVGSYLLNIYNGGEVSTVKVMIVR